MPTGFFKKGKNPKNKPTPVLKYLIKNFKVNKLAL